MKPLSSSSLPGLWRRLQCLLLVLSVLPFQSMAADPASAEYKLKAALLYKLARFVEWPSGAHGDPSRHFGICVLGRDDFGSALDALERRKVSDRPIAARRINQSESIDMQCQVVFVSDSKQAFVSQILRNLGDRPILTIGDTERFAEKGGMIEFTRGDKRIGFNINLQSAKAARLKIAAPLLDLATIVDRNSKGDSR